MPAHDLRYYLGPVPHNNPNIQCVWPKASKTQLWYGLYTLVKPGFDSSILDNQSFFCNWFIVMDNFHTCVCNQSQFTDWSKSLLDLFLNWEI